MHWRTDGLEGMHLGEAAAIALLQDVRHTYNEPFAGFTFTKFDGTTDRHLTIEVKQLNEGPEALRFRAFLFLI